MTTLRLIVIVRAELALAAMGHPHVGQPRDRTVWAGNLVTMQTGYPRNENGRLK